MTSLSNQLKQVHSDVNTTNSDGVVTLVVVTQ